MTKNIENLLSFPVMHKGTLFLERFLPFSYIGTHTQRTPPFSVENTNATVYDAAVAEVTLLSISITLRYINI